RITANADGTIDPATADQTWAARTVPQMNDHTAPAGTGNGRTATRVASDPGAFQKARAEKMAIDARRAARAGGAPRPAHRPREGRAVAVRVRAHVAGPLASVAGAYRRRASTAVVGHWGGGAAG